MLSFKRFTLSFLFLFQTTLFSLSAASSNGFEEVATVAIPAVVSIRVAGDKLNASSPSSPGEVFGDEFWSRFFGVTPKNYPPRSPKIGLGSGFIVSPDGYILTNNHIVGEASQIKVILTDGREFDATVVGSDRNTDVAVIKIQGGNLPYLPLGNSEALRVGQWVVAIGNPLGLKASLTVGVVSATGRDNLHISDIEDFIQTDAAINQGNSGGPLLNLDGEVVGMNTAIATNTGGYMGIGFAIPSKIIDNVKNQLMATGTVSRGFVGVTLQQIDHQLAEALELEGIKGALIADVIADSPAQKAGLKQGDVIVKYNDHEVLSPHALHNIIALMEPGTEISFTVQRGRKTLSLKVIIGTHPLNMQVAGQLTTKVGFDVTALTPEVKEQLGYINETGVYRS